MKIHLQLALFAAPLLVISRAQAAPVLTPTTPAALQTTLKKSKGKPTLVNFWATWCSSCVAELPALGKLQRANKGRANVIFVATNETAPNSQVGQILSRSGIDRSLIFRSSVIAFFEEFDKKTQLSLPITLLYDKNGRLVKRVNGEHTQSEYQKMLAPLLK